MNLTGDEVTTDEVEKIVIYASGAFITFRLNWSLILPIRKRRALSGHPRRSSNFKLFFRRPILSNALRADEGISGLLHRSCAWHTIHIGERVLSIARW